MSSVEKQRAGGSFNVVLETPQGVRSFSCAVDDYVWEAAARNGIDLPATCHQGQCLSCAGLLLSGQVDQRDAASYFGQDKDAGFVLLCRAKPVSDLHITTHKAAEMRAHRIASGLPAPYG